MTVLPTPSNHWPESIDSNAALLALGLTPYKTTAGYWVFVQFGLGPAGSSEGAVVSGAYDTLVTTTHSGLSVNKAPSGYLTFT